MVIPLKIRTSENLNKEKPRIQMNKTKQWLKMVIPLDKLSDESKPRTQTR